MIVADIVRGLSQLKLESAGKMETEKPHKAPVGTRHRVTLEGIRPLHTRLKGLTAWEDSTDAAIGICLQLFNQEIHIWQAATESLTCTKTQGKISGCDEPVKVISLQVRKKVQR